MTRYTHLTEHERYHIYLMNKQNCTLTGIAKTMGRSRSTISREIKCNTGGNGYHYKQAHRFAQTRHEYKHKHIKLNDELKLHIQQKLNLYCSPEQISGRLRMEENISISAESIYRLILKDKATDGSLYQYLRHQGKKYRKRYGKQLPRAHPQSDISDRPSSGQSLAYRRLGG